MIKQLNCVEINLLRQLEDTTKSKIKIDFLVLAPVALYDLWILESVLSPIFDGFFYELIYKIITYFYEILFDLM